MTHLNDFAYEQRRTVYPAADTAVLSCLEGIIWKAKGAGLAKLEVKNREAKGCMD